MQLTVVIVALLQVALVPSSPPPDDPVALEIGFRKVRRSELLRAVGENSSPDAQKAALRNLANQILLLQEADRSKLVKNLPASPRARADAFLESVVSEQVICGKLTERELQVMYKAMRPRFVHGHLYRIAELRLSCWEDSIGCKRSLTRWAMERWAPVLPALRSARELHMLWDAAKTPPGVLQFREYTVHVDEAGKSAASPELVAAIRQLRPGRTALLSSARDIRAPMLLEYEPPSHRDLTNPDVRAQVKNELCPRTVKRNRETYLDNLRRSAYVKIHRQAWPASVILPENPSN